jgi:hypothetical protein
VWNPAAGRYEWATVRYDFASDQQIVHFENGTSMARVQDCRTSTQVTVNYGARHIRAEAAMAMVENTYAARGRAFPAPAPVEAHDRPRRRRTFWAMARRLLRRWLRHLRPARPAHPTRASVIHHVGFGGLRP